MMRTSLPKMRLCVKSENRSWNGIFGCGIVALTRDRGGGVGTKAFIAKLPAMVPWAPTAARNANPLQNGPFAGPVPQVSLARPLRNTPPCAARRPRIYAAEITLRLSHQTEVEIESIDVEDAVPFPVVVVMIWQYMAANHSG